MHSMGDNGYAYGLWGLVIVNSALLLGFLFSFARPHSKTDWRSLGVFSAFLVALFAEMYGFPLTIYLLTTWLGSKYPVTNPFTHEHGHLLGVFLGVRSGHFSLLHVLSNLAIFGGVFAVAKAWKQVHDAQGSAVKDGLYAYVRHPQYSGFILIILGFLVQWPTLITLAMAPILVFRYIRLARREESQMIQTHGEAYRTYMKGTPAFIPRWSRLFGSPRHDSRAGPI